MGGTISSGGGVPALQPTYAPNTAAGLAPTTVATTGGGTVAAAPATDLASAVAQLQAAVGQLAAAVSSLQGAAGVQGGGGVVQQAPPGTGCGCGSTTAPASAGSLPSAPPLPGTSGDDAPQAMQADPATPAAPAAGGDVRQKIVQAARDELAKGVTEDAGDNTDSGGRIREYRTAVTGEGEDPDAKEPWCADFASWTWKQAGAPFGPDGKGSDYTVQIIDQAKQMGTWHQRGSYDPKPGDMVLIDWDGGSDVDHVAIVEKVEDGKVFTIGGNESDSIKTASYDLGDARMMGFVNPPGT